MDAANRARQNYQATQSSKAKRQKQMSQYRKRAARNSHGYCSRKERVKKTQVYKTFLSWQAMLWRCYCQSNNAYKNYGARGIIVCDRWKKSFANFIKDMSLKPEGMSLGRKNNDAGYLPGNCNCLTQLRKCVNISDGVTATRPHARFNDYRLF